MSTETEAGEVQPFIPYANVFRASPDLPPSLDQHQERWVDVPVD